MRSVCLSAVMPRSSASGQRSMNRVSRRRAELQVDVDVGAAGDRRQRALVAQHRAAPRAASRGRKQRRACDERASSTFTRLCAALPALRAPCFTDSIDRLVAGAAAEIAGERLLDLARSSRRAAPRSAAMIIPGVQMPHCAPPCVDERLLQRVQLASPAPGLRSSARRRRRACAAGTRHELTGTPSISTVHAPHSPSPQPSFVPVSAQSSRSTSSSRFIGMHVELTARWPLTADQARSSGRAASCDHQRVPGSREWTRTSKPAWRSALTTAGAGPSIGISPTPLAPNGPCLYGCSRMTRLDRRRVERRRDDVVGQRRVGHAAVAHHDFFEQRVAEALRRAALDLAGRHHGMNRLADLDDRGDVRAASPPTCRGSTSSSTTLQPQP